ncbi:nickel/cobalt transporter [Erwinia oleae]|uniref:nickel/cobalt transporter n=1 Tax=Erwinia oleae TaxID=796334 RepID=UPI000557D72A|nr:nickel/cobalt transporter [Erwinia oleae]
MSVNSTVAITRRVWPLLALAVIISGGGLLLWLSWPGLLLQSTLWQKTLHQQMTLLLQQVAAAPHQAGLALMAFSLIYGVLHAAGPGHGKVVIATFLATHPTRVKTSLRLTLAAAVVQGLVAIGLVTVLLGALGLSSRQLHLSSFWLEKGSYLLVVALGLSVCWRAVKNLRQTLRPPVYKRMLPVEHQHHTGCGCGHQHVPDDAALAQAVSLKTQVMVVLSMGLRPCSGAIMMLLFSKVIGVYGWGVLSALVMALGTALTVSLMALLVQMSRALALKLSRTDSAPGRQKRGVLYLSLCGGLLLIVAGVMLWLSATPMMSGGIRPLF